METQQLDTMRARLNLVFTLDYEIHGNGEGCPAALMVSPTGRLLDLLDSFGAKLTIMADTVEILRFRDHLEASGRDDWSYGAIETQLKDAVVRGHDVQLHLHPAYARAHCVDGRWILDYGDYDLARLAPERIVALVKEGKAYLEGLLRTIRPAYRCQAFRSANWSMCPSAEIVRALLHNRFKIDTSVFKHGFRDGLVHFDYSTADSDTVPWPVDSTDVCRRDEGSGLFEFPIYCESRPIWSFASVNRLYRVIQGWMHPLPEAPPASETNRGTARSGPRGLPAVRESVTLLQDALRRHALKLDFNQCSGGQMIAALERARARYADSSLHLPIVLIGHSKLFNGFNERQLRRFLTFVTSRPRDFAFATFDGFDLESFRSRSHT